jgi:hypothetical protein
MSQVKVIQTLKLGSEQAVSQKLAQLGARYRRPDPVTGEPLFKNQAGVVLRVRRDHAVEVLSNCVC